MKKNYDFAAKQLTLYYELLISVLAKKAQNASDENKENPHGFSYARIPRIQSIISKCSRRDFLRESQRKASFSSAFELPACSLGVSRSFCGWIFHPVFAIRDTPNFCLAASGNSFRVWQHLSFGCPGAFSFVKEKDADPN